MRISAISAASVSLLKGLGVWDAVQASVAILTADWKRGSGKRRMWCLTPLNGATAAWLYGGKHCPATGVVAGAGSASGSNVTRARLAIALHRHDDLQELELKGGEVIRAKLVIGADGANSQVRQMAGIGVHAWQMRSCAC
ncbi:FAD-dependent monooxygenase [Escherichia coli]